MMQPNTIKLKLWKKIPKNFGSVFLWKSENSNDLLIEVTTKNDFLKWEELKLIENIVISEMRLFNFSSLGIGVLPKDWRASFWLAKRLNLHWISLGKLESLDGIPRFNRESGIKIKLAVELKKNNVNKQIKKFLKITDIFLLDKKTLAKLQATDAISKIASKRIIIKL